jgi:hypothetical protein
MFRHYADQLDVEQAVIISGPGKLYRIGKQEAALEGALGYAAMDELGLLALRRLIGAADHDENIVLHREIEFVTAEPGYRHRDAVGAFADFLDIIRRVGVGIAACGEIDKPVQIFESDRGAQQRREIKTTHMPISFFKRLT